MHHWVDTSHNVPKWVANYVTQLYKRYGGSSSSFVDKYWILKGKRFAYKISFEDQGRFTRIFKKKREIQR